MPSTLSPITNFKLFRNFFQTLKQPLEKSHMSPTIDIAETHVSVHSSHHTPPGLLFGRFLMYYINSLASLQMYILVFWAVVFAMVEFSRKSEI